MKNISNKITIELVNISGLEINTKVEPKHCNKQMQLMTDETENYHEWAEFSIVYQLASEGKY